MKHSLINHDLTITPTGRRWLIVALVTLGVLADAMGMFSIILAVLHARSRDSLLIAGISAIVVGSLLAIPTVLVWRPLVIARQQKSRDEEGG